MREMHAVRMTGFVILLTLFAGTPVLAQAERGLDTIDEIIVTANRRAAVSAQDLGISLTALAGAQLEKQGLDSFADFASSVPGLSFGQRGPGQSLVILRGVNSSTTQFNTDEPESKETVGIYFDETPVSLNGYHPDPRLFDMNRIEVLRGPQGTLFGSGSLSGTIRYISNLPETDAFGTKFSTTFTDTSLGGGGMGTERHGQRAPL